MSAAPIFPIYQLQDAFESFCNGEPDVKPQHRSLYYFLLGFCRRRGNAPRFNLFYETGMHGSKIGSWKTYDTALRDLDLWGFVKYTPGANRFKSPVVELTFRNPTDDVLLTYWQSYCLSTANSTDDVSTTLVATLKEQLNRANQEIEKLKKGKPLTPATDLPSAASVGPGFDDFWNAYQRKDGSKSKIKRQWDALTPGVRQFIMDGLPAYRAAKTVNGPQYMPMPQTFLNGKLWEAEGFARAEPRNPLNASSGVTTQSYSPSALAAANVVKY